MLVDSNVFGKELYQNEFEVFFLKSSEEFYKSESADFIMKNTVPDFLIKVCYFFEIILTLGCKSNFRRRESCGFLFGSEYKEKVIGYIRKRTYSFLC